MILSSHKLDQADVPAVLQQITREMRIAGTPVREDHKWIVPVDFDRLVGYSTVGDESVDLTDLTPNLDLLFEVNAPREGLSFKVSGLNAECSVFIRWQGWSGGLVLGEMAGTAMLSINGDAQLQVQLEGDVGNLKLGNGAYVLAVSKGVVVDSVVVTGSTRLVLPHSIPLLRLENSCELKPAEQVCIERLEVAAAELEICTARGLRIGAVEGICHAGERPSMVMSSDAQRVSLGVDTATNLIVRPTGSGSIHFNVTEVITGVDFAGVTTLTMSSGSRGRNVVAHGQQVTLIGSPGAVLTELEGDWSIRSADRSHLFGTAKGFRITQSRRSLGGGTKFGGAVLDNFHLPSGPERREILAALGEAYHLNPATSDIPGSDIAYHLPRPWLARTKHPLLERLPEDVEFIGELARLAHDKGAPGSTRTRIAWCAYRVRHLGTDNRWERLVLAAYRLLGYGERPLPAFATWLALAALIAVMKLHSGFGWSLMSSKVLLSAILHEAFGPVGAILRTGSPTTELWESVLRAIIAIPLVTGTLALRNFVKQERR